MNVSKEGLKIIEEFEGCYLKAYKDSAGIWTIGIGTIFYPNRKPVKKGDTCTKEQAEEWLAFEMDEKCTALTKAIQKINLSLTQNQYDALASFLYNVGIGKCFPGTTMGDAIQSKNLNLIANAFLVYNKVTGIFGIKRVVKGLDNRRKAEKALFLS